MFDAAGTLSPLPGEILPEVGPVHTVRCSGMHAGDPSMASVEVIQNLLLEADRNQGSVMEEENWPHRNKGMSVAVVYLDTVRPEFLVFRGSR